MHHPCPRHARTRTGHPRRSLHHSPLLGHHRVHRRVHPGVPRQHRLRVHKFHLLGGPLRELQRFGDHLHRHGERDRFRARLLVLQVLDGFVNQELCVVLRHLRERPAQRAHGHHLLRVRGVVVVLEFADQVPEVQVSGLLRQLQHAVGGKGLLHHRLRPLLLPRHLRIGVHHNGEKHVKHDQKHQRLEHPEPQRAVQVVEVGTERHRVEIELPHQDAERHVVRSGQGGKLLHAASEQHLRAQHKRRENGQKHHREVTDVRGPLQNGLRHHVQTGVGAESLEKTHHHHQDVPGNERAEQRVGIQSKVSISFCIPIR
mmetsp:Transcript_3522/g.8338  ORF Transcript_3522/g.8338 Transcript_3522/m.8338 type:complete len:315 (-) Transcript_3522:11-955(-)